VGERVSARRQRGSAQNGADPGSPHVYDASLEEREAREQARCPGLAG